MDEKGFAFTPLTYLLIIPVLVIAISYGNIINEANLLGSLVIGGDVTYSSATTLISTLQKGAGDAGRNAAYNATRQVIDRNVEEEGNPFFASGTSRTAITNNITAALNNHVRETALKVKEETGRNVYINNVLIDDYTDTPFTSSNVHITQEDPFGFYVNIDEGIPIKIEQQNSDQVYELETPAISTYVSIEGLEDPYIWIYTKERTSNVVYKYPYYTSDAHGRSYYFNSSVDYDEIKLHHLWECLDGTDNPSGITPRPNYFPDPSGLSFFDRLEGKHTSSEPQDVRMSTFIIDDPLFENHGKREISWLDHEYVQGIAGSPIKIGSSDFTFNGNVFYLSNSYKTLFDLKSNY